MSRFTLQRTAGALALAFGLTAAAAGDPPAPADKDAAAETKRTLYLVKHRSARELADLVGPFYKGVAEVRAVPGTSDDALLVRAAPSAFDEVIDALEKLDRPPRTVLVEILTVDAWGDPAWKEGDFTGPIDGVAARIEDLRSHGVLPGLQRVRLAVVEGRPASVLVGEFKPNRMGASTLANGRTVASMGIAYRNVGIQVQAGVRVSPDGLVTVDLQFADVHGDAPDDGVVIGADENGKAVHATEFHLTVRGGTLTIPSGRARPVEETEAASKVGGIRKVVIVGARVVEPEK